MEDVDIKAIEDSVKENPIHPTLSVLQEFFAHEEAAVREIYQTKQDEIDAIIVRGTKDDPNN